MNKLSQYHFWVHRNECRMCGGCSSCGSCGGCGGCGGGCGGCGGGCGGCGEEDVASVVGMCGMHDLTF